MSWWKRALKKRYDSDTVVCRIFVGPAHIRVFQHLGVSFGEDFDHSPIPLLCSPQAQVARVDKNKIMRKNESQQHDLKSRVVEPPGGILRRKRRTSQLPRRYGMLRFFITQG